MSLEAIARDVLYGSPETGEGYGSSEGSINCCEPCCYIHLGSCGSGRGDGKDCVVIALVLAIFSALALFFISLAFTVSVGTHAQKRGTQTAIVQQAGHSPTQANLLVLVKDGHRSASVNTASLSIATAGFGLLTAAAIVALYVYAQPKAWLSPHLELAENLAIAGGASIGGGVACAGIYYGLRQVQHAELASAHSYLIAKYPRV